MVRKVEFYEAVKPVLGAEAARMLTESLVDPETVATRQDLEQLEARLEARMEAMLARMEASILKWMVGCFIPLWLGMCGIVVTLVLKG